MKEMDKRIEATLNALEGITRAQPSPDFEDKLFERLKFARQWTKWFRYSVAALVIFGLLNLLTIFSITSSADEHDYLNDNLLSDSTTPIFTITDNE